MQAVYPDAREGEAHGSGGGSRGRGAALPGRHRRRQRVVVERGPKGERKYRIDYAVGGKNVFYFLTPLEKGRLQVLPVAYDVRKKEWFLTTDSHLRPFPTNAPALPWTDPLYTFNTSCHGCHVSQVSVNYDLSTDSYRTTWTEPGINCETCHNPGGEHVRAARETPKGERSRM